MINIVFLVLCLVTAYNGQRVDGTRSTLAKGLELERQLKLMNKSPVVKSIQVHHALYIYIYTNISFIFLFSSCDLIILLLLSFDFIRQNLGISLIA